MMCVVLFYFTFLFVFFECTHIFSLDRDFSKLKTDKELSKNVKALVTKLKTFKVPVHPRIRLFYQLLKRGMLDYAQRTADTLYNPGIYKQLDENTL